MWVYKGCGFKKGVGLKRVHVVQVAVGALGSVTKNNCIIV